MNSVSCFRGRSRNGARRIVKGDSSRGVGYGEEKSEWLREGQAQSKGYRQDVEEEEDG
jgi:hypothetical protein